jgi:hypothetical protein
VVSAMKTKPTLAQEVANASRVLQNDLEAKQQRTPRDYSIVVEEARRLERLQARRRKLRRDLRAIEADIRHSKKMLKAFAHGD